MIRRNFIKAVPLLATPLGLSAATGGEEKLPGAAGRNAVAPPAPSPREYWLAQLEKISSPVLSALAANRLKKEMPVESKPGVTDRSSVTHLEAFGRTLAGMAPWLEATVAGEKEKALQSRFRQLALQSLTHAVDPAAPDYLNFSQPGQPLVDAAFLAQALLRAPRQLWEPLPKATRLQVLEALRATRVTRPPFSNWLLFSATIEAALLAFDGNYDAMRVDYAIRQHQQWYKGDGIYGDGPSLHMDYYNSYVIHPMLLDVVRTIHKVRGGMQQELALFTSRSQRYAAILERMIAPDGSFPPLGRSLAYRCGAFHALAQVALLQSLPADLPPAQVRCALTAVLRRTLDPASGFDAKGWLTIGLAGHQPGIGEGYISTGSLYLCTTAFLPLGLAASDPFWSGADMPWTSCLAFSGQAFPIDGALYEK